MVPLHLSYLALRMIISCIYPTAFSLWVASFSTKWRDWIAALLGSASSRILINGQPTKDIRHERGLRQRDPQSSLLFILAIDPLQRIIEVAAQKCILNPVLPRTANLRCSLYADDAAIFASPSTREMDHLHQILSFFWRMLKIKNKHL